MGGGNVDKDLFAEQWTTGNLGSIRFWVDIFSTAAQWLISIVGFGIVIFSIGKNALAGLYAVSPKIWDKVDEAKRASTFGNKEGGNRVMNLIGSVPTMILKCLPNVKALTVFDDEQITPKAYFMKSLPILCVEVFIGTFIFFGYPSQFAEKVGQFGTGVIDIVFANVDPVEWINKLPGQVAVYPYVLKGSSSDMDKNMLEITNKMVSTFMSRHTDLKKEGAERTALYIEQWVINNSSSFEQECLADRDTWKMSVMTQYYTSADSATEFVNKANHGTPSSDDTVSRAAALNVGVDCGSDISGKEIPSGDVLAVVVQYVRQTTDGVVSEGKSKTASLYVNQDSWSIQGADLVINVDTTRFGIREGQTVYIDGVSDKTATVTGVSGTSITIAGAGSASSISFGSTTDNWPKYTDSTGKTVKVKEITKSTGQTRYEGNATNEVWAPGADIVATDSSSTSTGVSTSAEQGEATTQPTTTDSGSITGT